MQTLWARVAQARCLCNCPSCISATNAIARRAATATARRTVPVGDVFTISLSSLAAGLAFADSRRKDSRREQWDKVIGETRANVEATETQQQNRLAALLDERVEALDDASAHGQDVAPKRAVNELKAWDIQKSEGRDDWVPYSNEEEEFLDIWESEELVHWGPSPNKVEDALDSRESEGQEDFISNSNKEKKALATRDSEELGPLVTTPDKISETLNTREGGEFFPWNSKNGTDTWLDVFEWAREEQKMRETSGFQACKGPPLSLLQSLSSAHLQEFLSNGSLLRYFCEEADKGAMWGFSVKKIRILEWSIAKMVLRLLIYSYNDGSQPSDDLVIPTISLLGQLLGEVTIHTKLDYLQERIRILNADRRSKSFYDQFERPPFPHYRTTIKKAFTQTAEMNTYLHSLVRTMEQRDVDGLLSKICYHLLSARVPPDIHTYNILLTRFCELGKDDQFKAVFDSMRETNMRPNETTHTAILRHFTATGAGALFCDYLARMEGRHGGLQSLAHPMRDIHPILRERFHVFGENNQKAVEKARMNSQVYESSIVGAIKFLGGQTAMRYYRSMVSEGWSPTYGIMMAILQDCCRRLDWIVGHEVLEQLERTTERVSTLTYKWMLRLCQRCGQMDFFDQILVNGVQCGALPASMLDLSDHAKAEDISFLIRRAQVFQPPRAIDGLENTAAKTSYFLDGQSDPILNDLFNGCEDHDILRRTNLRMDESRIARRRLEERLDVITRDIDYTLLQFAKSLFASNDLHSTNFLRSMRFKHGNQDSMQTANDEPYTSYSDVVKHEEIQKDQPKIPETALVRVTTQATCHSQLSLHGMKLSMPLIYHP